MLFIITSIYVIHNEKSNLISREVRRKIKDLKRREGRKLHNYEIHLQIRTLKIKLGNWCFVHHLLILVSWRILDHVLCPKKITALRPMRRESHWSILSLFSSSCYDFLCSLLPCITLQSYSNSVQIIFVKLT